MSEKQADYVTSEEIDDASEMLGAGYDVPKSPDFYGFAVPNYTQTPNDFFDKLLKQIDTVAELKFTLAIIRHTLGFHRTHVKFGISKIARKTGLARNSVLTGAELAEERGTVKRIDAGNGEAEWELIVSPPSKFAPPLQSLTITSSKIAPLKRNTKEKEHIYICPIAKKLNEKKFPFNPNSGAIIQGWKDDFPGQDDIILRAIEEASGRGARALAYVDKILIGWKANGVPPTREEQIQKAKNGYNSNGYHPGNAQGQNSQPIYEPSAADIALAGQILAEQDALFAMRGVGVPGD